MKKNTENSLLVKKLKFQIKPYLEKGWKIKRLCPGRGYLLTPLGEKVDKDILSIYKSYLKEDIYSQYEYVQINFLEEGATLINLITEYLNLRGTSNFSF